MNTSTHSRIYDHRFDEGNPLAERNTRRALALTIVMMLAEVLGGWIFNSMALLADGWHMGSHALALGLSAAAYAASRHFAKDPRFSFGTWKIEILGGYTSAIFLVVIAFLMLYHSIERLISPVIIHYNEAILVSLLGLCVNIICAWLLKGDHHHGHCDHHHDLNLRAAFIHVLTDIMTSIFAIIALIGGKWWGVTWLDPVMGIVGSVVVSLWSFTLLRDTIKVLLDAEMDRPLTSTIKEKLHANASDLSLTDFRLWRIGKKHYACIVSISSTGLTSPDQVKEWLSELSEIAHITVEINPDSI